LETLGGLEIGTVNISCTTLTLDGSSTITLSGDFALNIQQQASLLGKIIQLPFMYESNPGLPDPPRYYRTFSILGSGNVSSQSLQVTNLIVNVQDFTLLPSGVVLGNNMVGTCRQNVSRLAFSCKGNHGNAYNGTVRLNNTIAVTAWNRVHLHSNASIRGAVVILCAQHVIVSRGAIVSTNGRGCSSNTGIGSSIIVSDASDSGGSGGGYMGAGGVGQGVQGIGGKAHTRAAPFVYSSGSGGARNLHLLDADTLSGSGGGIAIINARESLMLLGAVSSDGRNGQGASGGGAGGTVVIKTRSLQGNGGSISTRGGVGGDSIGKNGAGGGGGGGQIVIYSPSSSASKYTNGQFSFQGIVSADQGQPGISCDNDVCAHRRHQTRLPLRKKSSAMQPTLM
jgi:hypothetical protein